MVSTTGWKAAPAGPQPLADGLHEQAHAVEAIPREVKRRSHAWPEPLHRAGDRLGNEDLKSMVVSVEPGGRQRAGQPHIVNRVILVAARDGEADIRDGCRVVRP